MVLRDKFIKEALANGSKGATERARNTDGKSQEGTSVREGGREIKKARKSFVK